jgi:hypothetical protein
MPALPALRMAEPTPQGGYDLGLCISTLVPLRARAAIESSHQLLRPGGRQQQDPGKMRWQQRAAPSQPACPPQLAARRLRGTSSGAAYETSGSWRGGPWYRGVQSRSRRRGRRRTATLPRSHAATICLGQGRACSHTAEAGAASPSSSGCLTQPCARAAGACCCRWTMVRRMRPAAGAALLPQCTARCRSTGASVAPAAQRQCATEVHCLPLPPRPT